MSKLISILISSLFSLAAFGQAESVRYVGFHEHTSMKNYYRQIPHPDSVYDANFMTAQKRSSNWHGSSHRSTFSPKKSFTGFWGKHSYPQASWEQVAAVNSNMLCTSITPIEKRFVSDKKVSILFFKVKIKKINHWQVTKLDIPRENTIYCGSSFDELMGEYNYMKMQSANPTAGGRNVRLVEDAADLERAVANKETGIILTVEGGHALMGKSFICKEYEPNFGIDSTTVEEIYNNIDSLKKLKHHVFFLTLSHMSWNALAAQAKSLDMKSKIIRAMLGYNSEDKNFRNVAFKKFDSGIVDSIKHYNRGSYAFIQNPCACTDKIDSSKHGFGWEVIYRLLDNSNGQHRILIDSRHMDVQGREQYIHFVDSMNKLGAKIPLIVSHAAVNGKTRAQARFTGSCPYADRYLEVANPEKFYRVYQPCFGCEKIEPIDLGKTGWFHPFSINLFDEEIAAVYKSDGIIGVTLEERVLGTGRHNYTKDHYKKLRASFGSICKTKDDFKRLKVIEPFMRNLLYIVEHSGYGNNDIRAWEHVALGSDFDGMIDPLDECATITDIPHFYSLLQKYLSQYATFLGKPGLLQNRPVDELLNMVFYKNGEGFIQRYFK